MHADDHKHEAHDEKRIVSEGREHVVQHPAQQTQATPHEPRPVVPSPNDAQPQGQPLAKTSGRKPGERSSELGQDSGTAWQESQQMGYTGRGGVDNPQKNP